MVLHRPTATQPSTTSLTDVRTPLLDNMRRFMEMALGWTWSDTVSEQFSTSLRKQLSHMSTLLDGMVSKLISETIFNEIYAELSGKVDRMIDSMTWG